MVMFNFSSTELESLELVLKLEVFHVQVEVQFKINASRSFLARASCLYKLEIFFSQKKLESLFLRLS